MKTTLSERVKLALAGPPSVSQVALARACGIRPPSVNDWASGKTKTIEGANLLNAAAFLKVNPKWLAEGVGPMRPSDQAPEVGPSAPDSVRQGIAMRLRSARENKKLAVEQVAEKLSMEPQTVEGWEAGRAAPDALALRTLAKLYDISADALLWEDSLSPDAMQLAAEFDSLNEKQKGMLRAMWMGFVMGTASDAEVEDRMGATKEFKYNKVTNVTPFSPMTQQPEGQRATGTEEPARPPLRRGMSGDVEFIGEVSPQKGAQHGKSDRNPRVPSKKHSSDS